MRKELIEILKTKSRCDVSTGDEGTSCCILMNPEEIAEVVLELFQWKRKEILEKAKLELKEFGKEYNRDSNCDLNYVEGFNQAVKNLEELKEKLLKEEE